MLPRRQCWLLIGLVCAAQVGCSSPSRPVADGVSSGTTDSGSEAHEGTGGTRGAVPDGACGVTPCPDAGPSGPEGISPSSRDPGAVGGGGGRPPGQGTGGGGADAGSHGAAPPIAMVRDAGETGGTPGDAGGDGAGGSGGSTGGGSTGGGSTGGGSTGGGSTGGGGSTPGADAGSTDQQPVDRGIGDGSDVVTIGDSWMARDAIEGSLDTVTGRVYRHHAVPTVRLLASTPAPSIPTQWRTAVQQDANIQTVIMTGGGNDILLSPQLEADCERGGSSCRAQVAQIASALANLWAEMAAAGVVDVVYVAYASDTGAAGQALADTASNGIGDACASAPLRCHILPSTDLVRGQYLSDGVHPVKAAYVRIAEAAYDLMTQEGMRR